MLAFGVNTVRGSAAPATPATATPAAAAPATIDPAVDGTDVAPPPVDGVASAPEPETLTDLEGCTLDVASVQVGSDGDAVACVQRALLAAGHDTGPIDGVFDDGVEAAAVAFQTRAGLYVDGIVGRRTAEQLGIWPGEASFVVKTPPPPAGATDLSGHELSPVASAGESAPELPPDAGQGTGERVVYSRAAQRVWAIDDDERIVRSYLVTGSQYANERPGVHTVYSKSEVATGWNFEADLPYMIRYQRTDRGNIGFHQIPIRKADGSTYQTIDELGERLSGGCQRQHPLDAVFLWGFAQVGTTVIVL